MLIRWFRSEIFTMITGRAAMAGLAAFFACVALGPRIIAWLRARKVGEKTEKGDSRALDALMRGKSDTPTMGGVFLSTAILIAVAAFGDFRSRTLPILAGAVTLLGLLGAVDD